MTEPPAGDNANQLAAAKAASPNATTTDPTGDLATPVDEDAGGEGVVADGDENEGTNPQSQPQPTANAGGVIDVGPLSNAGDAIDDGGTASMGEADAISAAGDTRTEGDIATTAAAGACTLGE